MVLKNYKPIDTENIMKQLHNGKVVSEKAVEPSLSQIPSVAHRRRQSMMDNTNYKFAYSRKKLILHDRDCDLVKHISRRLLFDHKAQLIDVDPNSLTIIVNKDKWLFQFHSDKLELVSLR